MSDEKQVDTEESLEKAEKEPSQISESTRSGNMANPIVLIVFMIFVMVLIITVLNLKNKAPSSNIKNPQDDPSLSDLKADLETGRMELNRQRMAMNLPPLEGAESADEIATRLKRDADTLAALAKSFHKIIADKNTQLSERNSEILRLEKLRQDFSMDNSRLQLELSRALSGGPEMDRLKLLLVDTKKQFAIAEQQLATSQQQLAAAQQQLAATKSSFSDREFNDLKRLLEKTLSERDFYQAQLNELQSNIEKAKLFASSETELLPTAVELFRRLRKLEGMKDSDLTTEYSKLGVELGANVLHTLNYATGSSELKAEDIAQLENIVANEAPDGDLILIIGYASKTGDSVANQRLSSDRATKAAEYYSGRKRPGQIVQAVYLGQTDRFSTRIPERNQICEVWIIRKKQ